MKFVEIDASVKDFELRGVSGNLDHDELIEAGLCNLDTLLDTKN